MTRAGWSISSVLLLLLFVAALGLMREGYESQPLMALEPSDSAGWVTDGLGRAVAIPQPPRRIISIFASNTELLCAIGAGPHIVGIEEKTRFPPDILDRPLVGGRLGFSVEHIAELAPDLVVMTTARHAADQLLRPLSAIGVPVVILRHQTIEQVFTNLDLLGQATHRREEAARCIEQLRLRLGMVTNRIAGQPRPRCYFETGSAGSAGFMTAGKDTYTLDALHLAGGVSIFPDRVSGLPVSGEAVFLADPEVILVCGDAAAATALMARPGWQHLRAVRQGRVYPIPRALTLIPGPRIIEGVEQLAAILHPQ